MASDEIPENPNTPPTPFNFDDPKQRSTYERLLRLVGPSAADFYKDACRLMSGSIQPPLAATTNLVSLSLREIEGSLREVLVPLAKRTAASATESVPRTVPESEIVEEKTTHADEIRSVLTLLDIGEETEIAKAWLSLPGKKKGLQKYTHRRGLKAARPVDDEFKELWAKMDVILYGVLDKFEGRYVIAFDSIEKLAKTEAPAEADARFFVSSVPNNFVSHNRFFEGLENPAWLPLLDAEGVFSDPPQTEYGSEEGSRTVRYPLWPAASFLLKMAPKKPAGVRKILLAIASTDNANVKNALLDIAAALPKDERLLLLSKIKEWVRAEHSMYISTSASGVIRKFIEDGESSAAVEIAKTLLELTAEKQKPITLSEGHVWNPAPKPRSRLDDWQYGHFIKDEFPKLLQLDPDAGLALVADLLEEFVTLGHSDDTHEYYDLSYISRPAVENHPQNRFNDDLEDHLVEAVRDAASAIIKSDPARNSEVVNSLKERRWSIFIRIAMHLLAEADAPNPDLLKEFLVNEEYFDISEVKHEYANLLGRHFGKLDPDSQKVIYGWIVAANKIESLIISREPAPTDDEAQRYKEHWQLEKLTLIGERQLSADWEAKRKLLVEKYSEPAHPDFASYSESYVGPTSSVRGQDLAEMGTKELLELLKTWQPPTDSHRSFGPTKDGLGREIATAIRTKPDFFEGLAKDFEGLDPTYVRTFIQTFHELAQNGRTTDWVALIGLSRWVVDEPRTIPNRTGEIMDQDPDWGWTRRAITSLIATGLNRNDIPYELREDVWAVIEPLAEDPDPSLEQESRRDSPIEDSYAHAINTVRGHAIQMVIEYGLWVRRNTKEEEEHKNGSFAEMPEVQKVLDAHLSDPSIAVRAVYGRFIPWLILLDKDWANAHVQKLFPKGGFKEPLYKAAWGAYMLYVPVYNDVFELLRKQYTSAVDDLTSTPYSEKNSRDPQRKLAEHLVVMYWRGLLKLNDPLLVSFWENADDSLREHLMDFIGMSLRNNEESLTSDVEALLHQLWESRLAEAAGANDKTKYQKEMSGFGWWFAAGKLEEEWACDQYLKALDFGSKTRTHHFVAEVLAEMATRRPVKILEILTKIIDLDQPSWMLMGDKEEVFKILRAALQSSDDAAHKLAREIISRLVARGYSEYADLLREFPESGRS